jgi:mono/diheme cytochrome c family protein
LPAFIPVAYELTILFSSFGAFFGMLALNGLPRLSNPVFSDPRFDRATDDRFFIMIDAKDPRYQEAGVRALLESTTSFSVSEVCEDDSPKQIPKWMLIAVSIVGLIALIPPLFAMRMRVTNADKPRFHVFFEMDFQPKKLPQQTSSLFADGRVMRPHVPGTIARGELIEDIDYYTGIDMEKLAAADRPRSEMLVNRVLQQGDAAEPQDGQTTSPPVVSTTPAVAPAVPAAPVAPVDTTPYLGSIPIPVTPELIRRGRERFEIYCAVCHGIDGSGNGLVAQRAREINATTWVPPSSLHQSIIQQQPDGKIFTTITNGIRKMPGYSGQINVRDRWAIVAYVRALQLSRDADRKGMVATTVKGN